MTPSLVRYFYFVSIASVLLPNVEASLLPLVFGRLSINYPNIVDKVFVKVRLSQPIF